MRSNQDAPVREPVLVIVNPAAGGGRGARAGSALVRELSDGTLNDVVAGPGRTMLWLSGKLLARRHRGDPRVSVRVCRRVTIRAARAVAAVVDGEPLGHKVTCAEFSVLPQALALRGLPSRS
jgi:diacylglycerol kinase family enzyme